MIIIFRIFFCFSESILSIYFIVLILIQTQTFQSYIMKIHQEYDYALNNNGTFIINNYVLLKR